MEDLENMKENKSTVLRVETSEQREIVIRDARFWTILEVIGGFAFTIVGAIMVACSKFNWGLAYVALGLTMQLLGVLISIDYRYRCVLWHLDRAGLIGNAKKKGVRKK